MNNERRARIEVAKDKLREIRDEVGEIKSEEEAAYDNLPESLQNGEKGDSMQSAIERLDEAFSSIDQAADELDEAMNA